MNGSRTTSPLDALPTPGGRRLALRVSPPAERSLRAGHPWVYRTSLEAPLPEAPPGDLAVAFDRKRRFLAAGLWDPDSPITFRALVTGAPETVDAAWFARRLRERIALRAPLRADGSTDGLRLVNGESDGFPGLVADRFAGTCVVKLYTAAWIPHLRAVLGALQELERPERTVLRLARSLAARPDGLHGLSDGQVLSGPPLDGPVVFRENGLRFESEPILGQKTGFFLDQRDNRARVGGLARGLDVLNVFSYTGGFSLYAARGGARSVVSVDLSEPATAAARRNFALNAGIREVAACRHEALAEDAFRCLDGFRQAGRRFGLVVLDPPMFAQSAAQVEGALAAYRRLTRLGLSVLAPGGVLVQASCSARVPAEAFFEAVHDEAHACGRPLREIARTGHAADHPCTCPENVYLKCLFARA